MCTTWPRSRLMGCLNLESPSPVTTFFKEGFAPPPPRNLWHFPWLLSRHTRRVKCPTNMATTLRKLLIHNDECKPYKKPRSSNEDSMKKLFAQVNGISHNIYYLNKLILFYLNFIYKKLFKFNSNIYGINKIK